MPKAIWKGTVLAESERTVVVEGHHYFPPDSVKMEYFQESNTKTESPEKGTAHYFHIKVEGEVNVDAAWRYPRPRKEAKHIRNYMAFWRGVEIEE